MTNVFISHSSEDHEFIERELLPLLKQHGLTPWYSRESINASKVWHNVIGEALKECEYFLLVMTQRSVDSKWVKHELGWWIRKHEDKNIVPVLLEYCDPDDFHIFVGGIEYVDARAGFPEKERHKLLRVWGNEPRPPVTPGPAERRRPESAKQRYRVAQQHAKPPQEPASQENVLAPGRPTQAVGTQVDPTFPERIGKHAGKLGDSATPVMRWRTSGERFGRGPILGIDLGESVSRAAVLLQGEERPTVITLEEGLRSHALPSVFGWTEEGPQVGMAAEKLLEAPEHRGVVIQGVRTRLRYPDQRYVAGDKCFTPSEVSSFFLQKLREAAEDQLGLERHELTEAVITVPSHFGQIERVATRMAGEHAGFTKVQLLDEPVAASVGMRLHERMRGENLVLLVDLGGGSLTVTLMKVGQGVADGGCLELGRDGHAALGAWNWDKEIAKLVVLSRDEQRGPDFRRDPDFFDRDNIQLYRACEEARMDFASQEHPRTEVLVSYTDRQLGETVNVPITRDQYEKSTEYLADGCALICDRLLRGIHEDDLQRAPRRGLFFPRHPKRIGWHNIDQVLLIGEGSGIRAVRRKLGELWGKKPILVDEPELQTVYGAAMAAASIRDGVGKELYDVPLRSRCSYGYYAESPSGEREFVPVIRKNTRVPAANSVAFPVTGRGSKIRIELVMEHVEFPLRGGGRLITNHLAIGSLELAVPPEHENHEKHLVQLLVEYSSHLDIEFSARIASGDSSREFVKLRYEE
jgi:molecular chaperone DnaK